MIAHSRQALEDTAQELWIVRVLARLCLAVGLQMDGSLEQAYAIIQAGLSEEPELQPVLRAILFHCTCFIDWMVADLQTMERSAQLCINLLADHQPAGIMGFGRLHLGAVRYHHNDLPAAEAQFGMIVRQPYLHYGEDYAYCACGLALTYQAQGRDDEARAVSQAAIQQMIETGNRFLLPIVEAFAAELALYQGDLITASTWAAEHAQNVRQLPMVRFYEPQLTPVKIWLAQATPASLQQAAQQLDHLAAFVEATHNTRFAIEVLALQALLDAAQGQETSALQHLERALRLAQAGGFLRLFVDLGSAMAELLARIQFGEAYMQAYVQQINAAFKPVPVAATAPAVNDDTGLDALTNREREVLDCLVARLTDKEIADRLMVSLHTVRSHSKNIFAKLGAHNRREAVQRAGDLGLVLEHEG